MGAGQSSGFSSEKGLIDDSIRVSEIPRKILTLMFKHSDFTDLLALSNIEACPQYVFTSAETLGNLFEKIQIRPEKGPAGEYIFAPVRRLAPELLKNSGAIQPSLEERMARDNICVDVAYYHVRIFQIYAALALTVLNTNPLRGPATTYASRVPSQVYPQAFKPSAFSAVRARGGKRTTRRKQVGGKISPSGAYMPLYNKIVKTPFMPFLIPYFTPIKSSFANAGTTYLVMDDKGPGEFTITWDPERYSVDDMSLRSFYKIRSQNTNRGSEAPIIESTINMKKKPIMQGTAATLYIGREKIATFFEQIGNWRYYLHDNDSEVFTDPRALYQEIHAYFGSRTEYRPNAAPPVAYEGAIARASGISRATGKSSFDGFDSLYKMYSSLVKGEAAAPKAYLIARAMTLMRPIENAAQVMSDVCKTSRLDFETNAEYLMPKSGTNPRSNIYLRSFVSLFYDTYRVERDKGTKRVILGKSQPGASELARASRLMAGLYNIPDKKEEFLESTVNFRGFDSICGAASRSRDTTIYYTDPQLKDAMKAHIGKMLAFQQEHNERTNRLLMRMFVLNLSPREGEKLVLSSELEGRGLNSVNDFCKEARDLLLNYYLKSEAFYIQGTILLENNIGRWASDAAVPAPAPPAYQRNIYGRNY